jgi:L-lactate dehydrogenase
MKVAIIGAGRVGSSLAFTLLVKNAVNEITLVDINKEKSEGEALDLKHGLSSLPYSVGIKTKDISEIKDADLIVITAGIPRKPGETRLDLLKKNASLVKEISQKISYYNKKALLFVISNPVDVMTYVVLKNSNFPKKKVFGLGTQLDTVRFKSILADIHKINSNAIETYVLGEHGESMVPVWSHTKVYGICIENFGKLKNPKDKEKIFERVKKGGAEVIRLKGGTNWAVALSASEVIECLSQGVRKIFPLSILVKDYYGNDEICISVPVLLSKNGIEKQIFIDLSEEERKLFEESGRIIQKAIRELENL